MIWTVTQRIAFAVCLLAASPALAKQFVPLPAVDGQATTLKVRFVRYLGGTNGAMIVDIRNVGKRPQHFVADGLFFVPDGKADSAPQRLGAAGPFDVRHGDAWQARESLTVTPGRTERVRLQVFCLDSHRASPGAGQGFQMGHKRLPKKLRQQIKAGADTALKKNKGNRERSKSEIQSHVWKTRNQEWLEIDGEGKQEDRQRTTERDDHRQQRRNLNRFILPR